MKYATEMASGGMIFITSFMKGCYLNNLRGYSIGITDERDL
jgi:hypothetical protein